MISVNVSYCCAMKQVFVENALADVLKKVDEDVESVEYSRSSEAEDAEEYVIIGFKSGGTKRICITADSLAAVVKDVFKIF